MGTQARCPLSPVDAPRKTGLRRRCWPVAVTVWEGAFGRTQLKELGAKYEGRPPPRLDGANPPGNYRRTVERETARTQVVRDSVRSTELDQQRDKHARYAKVTCRAWSIKVTCRASPPENYRRTVERETARTQVVRDSVQTRYKHARYATATNSTARYATRTNTLQIRPSLTHDATNTKGTH